MNWTKRFRTSYRLPLNLLGSLPRSDGSASAAIHEFCARDAWQGRSVWGRLGLLAGLAIWPFVVLGMIVEATYWNGRTIKRRTGRGVFAQVLDQI